MKKLSLDEHWECFPSEEIKISEYETARENAINFVFSNIGNMEIFFISEEGKIESNFAELQEAIELARGDELERFVTKGYIPFEDGNLKIVIKN